MPSNGKPRNPMGRVRKTDTCWLWTGFVKPDGYGQYGPRPAHRVIYELLVGPIPAGLHLDHLCRNRLCVNPEHLEPVTHAENVRRGEPAQRTKCVNGHPYDEVNTYIRPTGQRDCRACIRQRTAAYKARKVAA